MNEYISGSLPGDSEGEKKKNRLKQEPLRSSAFLPTQIMFFLVQHSGFIRLEKTQLKVRRRPGYKTFRN